MLDIRRNVLDIRQGDVRRAQLLERTFIQRSKQLITFYSIKSA